MTIMCLFAGFGGNFRNKTQVKDSAETRADGLLFDLKNILLLAYMKKSKLN